MYRKTFIKLAILFVLILLLIPAVHVLAETRGGQTLYLPAVAKSATCSVPSSDHPTIQGAIDNGCEYINLTAGLYVENIRIQNHEVTIVGQSPANTIIDGNGSGPVFWVEENSIFTLENVTVRNGFSDDDPGAGIRNFGETHLANTIIKDNRTDCDDGSGIGSLNMLTVENSWIVDNSANPGCSGSTGGGVFVRGTANLTNTTISRNEAYEGGGLAAYGHTDGTLVTLVNSEISNNEAARDGGGILTSYQGNLTMSNSLVSGNQSRLYGGGIMNAADMQIVDSSIVGNKAGIYLFDDGCGGGIANSGDSDYNFERGKLFIDRVEIRDNVGIETGGGICNTTRFFGDAIGEVEIYNSLVVGNSVIGTSFSAGGGYYSRSIHIDSIENSTFYENSSLNQGGAIRADYLHLRNVTVTKNDAVTGGGVYGRGNIQMINSIVASNLSGGDCYEASGTQLTSLGHNISSDNSCELNAPGDMPNTNPLLGPLQNNGGPTQTSALPANSPAVDSADNAACPPMDQRGIIRPQGPACDIGAYEYNG